jgi:hypothetical protein
VWSIQGHVVIRITPMSGQNAVVSGLFFGPAAGIAPPPPPSTSTATFVKLDTSTQGNWRSAYGADGYTVIGDQAVNPSYANPAPAGQQLWVYTSSTTEVRAPQKGSNPADRVAAVWFSWNTFTVDLNFSDQAVHQVALYFLDWDRTDRRQTVDILDGDGNLLNSQVLTSSFNGGAYLVWNLSGKIRIRVSLIAGLNSVISGLYFGTASGPPPPPPVTSGTATFVRADTTTKGSWHGVYGLDGYTIVGDQSLNPGYVTPVPASNQSYTYVASTSDVRAPQKAANPADRVAGVWFNWGTFTVDLNFTDQAQHQLAIYCLDWDTNFRSQTVDVLDSNNNLLNSQSISSFNGGVYLVWNVSGHVKLRFTLNGGLNPVVSGLFFR